MPDYKSMYFVLAGKTADAIEILDKFSSDLKEAQLEMEEHYIGASEKNSLTLKR